MGAYYTTVQAQQYTEEAEVHVFAENPWQIPPAMVRLNHSHAVPTDRENRIPTYHVYLRNSNEKIYYVGFLRPMNLGYAGFTDGGMLVTTKHDLVMGAARELVNSFPLAVE